MCDWIFYQQKMEQFYNAMADVIMQKNYYALIDDSVEEDIICPELLLFEEDVCVEPTESQLEEFLEYVVEKGYRIVMNFYAPDVVLGNVAVKIHDKWFAFGQCRNDDWVGECVTEIWSLKYVLPNLRYMEVKLRYTIPIRPQQGQPAITT